MTRARRFLGDKGRGVRREAWTRLEGSGDGPISGCALNSLQDEMLTSECKTGFSFFFLSFGFIDVWISATVHSSFYDGLTYLRVLAVPLLPIPTTSKWRLETTWSTPPPSQFPNGGKTLPYLPSHPGKPSWPQQGGTPASCSPVPSGPCADKPCLILKLQSKVSRRRGSRERERGDVHKVIRLFSF